MTNISFPIILSGLIFTLVIIGVLGKYCSKNNNSTNKTAPSTPVSSPKKFTEKSTDFVDIEIDV